MEEVVVDESMVVVWEFELWFHVGLVSRSFS
jgi:hypothetical protein